MANAQVFLFSALIFFSFEPLNILLFPFEGNLTSTTYVDFFDSSFTFLNESIHVSCCGSDTIVTKMTCGRGTSCIGQCSSIGASLCLSGKCTGDPDDCNISLEPEKRRKGKGGTCEACGPSQELRKCFPSCRVKKKPSCCFHPKCYEMRPKYCSDTNYFSGILTDHFPSVLSIS